MRSLGRIQKTRKKQNKLPLNPNEENRMKNQFLKPKLCLVLTAGNDGCHFGGVAAALQATHWASFNKKKTNRTEQRQYADSSYLGSYILAASINLMGQSRAAGLSSPNRRQATTSESQNPFGSEVTDASVALQSVQAPTQKQLLLAV